jgi:hypothetical protein
MKFIQGYIICIILFLFGAAQLKAQDTTYIGVNFGVISGNAFDDNNITDKISKYSQGYTVGAYVDFASQLNMYLHAGISYSHEKTGLMDLNFANTHDYVDGVVDYSNLKLYFEPRLNYQPTEIFNFYFQGGLYGELLLKSTLSYYNIPSNLPIRYKGPFDATKLMNSGTGGILGGMGIGFNIPSGAINMELNGNIGLPIGFKDEHAFSNKIWPTGICVLIAYQYRLITGMN